MSTSQDSALREQLLHALRGDESHIEFDAAIEDFPVDRAGILPKGAPHTAWQLLEHMRIAQHDILEFSRNPNHASPKWPDDYWPEAKAPIDKTAWEASIAAFRKQSKEMADLIQDLGHDLYKPIEGGQGQTLLREALVLAAHNSYHLGQLMFLKRMLL
jgi:DinB superfamily